MSRRRRRKTVDSAEVRLLLIRAVLIVVEWTLRVIGLS